MKPSGDAQTFYKTHQSIERRELAEQKAREAREKLSAILPLSDRNRIEASKSDGSMSRR